MSLHGWLPIGAATPVVGPAGVAAVATATGRGGPWAPSKPWNPRRVSSASGCECSRRASLPGKGGPSGVAAVPRPAGQARHSGTRKPCLSRHLPWVTSVQTRASGRSIAAVGNATSRPRVRVNGEGSRRQRGPSQREARAVSRTPRRSYISGSEKVMTEFMYLSLTMTVFFFGSSVRPRGM